MASTSQSGLAKVQNLYVLQVELVDCMASGLKTAAQVQKAKKHLQQFKKLLKDADPSYMGGEDVYATLEKIQKDMSAKIARARGTKRVVAKKATKTAAKKKVATKKKTATKKATAKKATKKKVTAKKKK